MLIIFFVLMVIQIMRLSSVQLLNSWLNLDHIPKTQTNLSHHPSNQTSYMYHRTVAPKCHCVSSFKYLAELAEAAHLIFGLINIVCEIGHHTQIHAVKASLQDMRALIYTPDLPLQCFLPLQPTLCGGLLSCAFTQRFQRQTHILH